MIFPEIFITGELIGTETERELCAHAFSGWGCCAAGATPPTNFGLGMVVIGEKLGITATETNLEKYAIEKGWLKAEK